MLTERQKRRDEAVRNRANILATIVYLQCQGKLTDAGALEWLRIVFQMKSRDDTRYILTLLTNMANGNLAGVTAIKEIAGIVARE